MGSLRLSDGIGKALEEIFGSDGEARKQLKIAQTEDVFKEAVDFAFKNGSALVLQHVNAVYLFQENGKYRFLVYSDDSSVRSSLDARLGLIDIFLRKKGVVFDGLKILPSQRSVKERHPYQGVEKKKQPQKCSTRRLSESEMADVDDFVSTIEDEKVKKAFKTALVSYLENE